MRGKVLVVDDEKAIRKVIRLHLTKEGFEVIEAVDGEDGIKKVGEGDTPLMLNLIICDIRMPKINGIDAISYFRQQFPLTPVIVLTGFPDVKMAVNLMKEGVVEYLVKPVTKDTLVKAVKKGISERKWSREFDKTIQP